MINLTFAPDQLSFDVDAAAAIAEDLSADPAVVLPPEGGELCAALVAVDGDGVGHPVLPVHQPDGAGVGAVGGRVGQHGVGVRGQPVRHAAAEGVHGETEIMLDLIFQTFVGVGLGSEGGRRSDEAKSGNSG